MDHIAIALHRAAHRQKPRLHHRLSEGQHDLRPDHQVGDPGFVFERDEAHALGRARALAHQHQTGQRHALSIARVAQITHGRVALPRHAAPQKRHGVRLE